jgi:hypothetical protein
MKLTKQSEQLMSFFINNKCFSHTKQTKKTDNIMKKLFVEMRNGFEMIKSQSSQSNMITDTIENVNQIPKPKTFDNYAFPQKIINHIHVNSSSIVSYKTQLFGRKISIFFVLEDKRNGLNTEMYQNYVDNILVWLSIVDKFASKLCSPELTIYIYHTSIKKMLPEPVTTSVLSDEHVNTAFTRTCPKTSEIVVFRKEEWFKVFMHETFHNFGLDFSDMDNTHCHSKILNIFRVNSEPNLFEAYTEFWARIMNALFCSYHSLKNKNDIDKFLSYAEFFINMENSYSFFQTVKVLHYMGLDYNILHKNNEHFQEEKNKLYKEKTSVLSYYVITLILTSNYQDFLSWCYENNGSTSFLQFKKTMKNQDLFCKFIEKKYKSKQILHGIECGENLLNRLMRLNTKKGMKYLLKNLRMTICECEL